MTCHRVCNKSNLTGVAYGEGNAYPSGAPVSALIFVPFWVGFVLFMLSNYIFSCFLVPCCDVRYDFHVNGVRIVFLFCREFMLYLLYFEFIYLYWCPTRFPFQKMFVSFNSVTCGTGTVNPSEAPGFSGVLVVRSLVFCVM